MSGYEEQLHARAEMLEETGELAAAATVILAFASGAGLDPRAVVSLRTATRALDPAGGVQHYEAGSRTDRHPGSGCGSDAEDRMADAARRIGTCEAAAEILDSLVRRLQAALRALCQVPHDLGEVYELIYAFIRRGGKMPRLGRWIEGGTPA